MAVLKRVARSLILVIAVFGASPAVAQPPEPQDKFVPMSEVPPEEQLPAAPLVGTAYAFVWLAVLVYVISVARRLDRVQGELQRLEADVKRGTRG